MLAHRPGWQQTVRALDMRPTVDREEFFGFQHGDARLKLIERLAAADRVGELPDYILEFVDSLRTRTISASARSATSRRYALHSRCVGRMRPRSTQSA